ncbi:(Fe-S)-binding protein [Hippea alviniae]|uniref:(Fe-S)-binding protein n=1 Tax=Hippea alviniae TaxID=1279027 RepID=UPI0003B75D73|nr:(Fe-S)-binding protein [Hippea alviniae]
MILSLKKIVKELKELEELTLQCMKCGICQSVCPLYEKDRLEQSVSRGKISLIEAIYEGRLDSLKGAIKYLDYCILCGRCKRFCPSSVKTDEIFVGAKSVLRRIDKLPVSQKIFLKTAMNRPNFVESIQPTVSVGMRLISSKLDESTRKLKIPIEINVKNIKSVSFTKMYGGLNKAKNEKMRVIFYPGCAINYVYTSWGEAIVETLKMFKVSVYVPKVNNCCGIPAATMGDMDLYKTMVERNFDWFDSINDADYIITACPTCQWGLSDLGVRVTDRKIRQRMIDVLVFLKEVLNVKINPNSENSTLHVPCHYEHSKDSVMIDFLKESVSKNLKPLKNQSCCGFGGTFRLKHNKTSREVGSKKLNEIKRYDVLYTPCPGCVMQFTDLVSENSLNVEVKHPIETIYKQLLKERLNGRN